MDRRAYDALLAAADLETATSVLEVGAGTGYLAERALRERLPPAAGYTAVENSHRLGRLLSTRLSRWRERTTILHADGMRRLPFADRLFDRYLSTYVLDGCTAHDLVSGLKEASRMLAPGGLLCALVIAEGSRPLSKFGTAAWNGLHTADPRIVGNSRTIILTEWLDASDWEINLVTLVETGLFASSLVVATKREQCPRD